VHGEGEALARGQDVGEFDLAGISPVPASRMAAVTARSPAATSAAIIATMSGSMSSFSFMGPQIRDPPCSRRIRGHISTE